MAIVCPRQLCAETRSRSARKTRPWASNSHAIRDFSTELSLRYLSKMFPQLKIYVVRKHCTVGVNVTFLSEHNTSTISAMIYFRPILHSQNGITHPKKSFFEVRNWKRELVM